eukprot:48411-Eustigmatos_ZCMA.PRE.1
MVSRHDYKGGDPPHRHGPSKVRIQRYEHSQPHKWKVEVFRLEHKHQYQATVSLSERIAVSTDRSISAQVHRSFLEPDAVTCTTRAITVALVGLTRDRSLDGVRLMRIMQYIDGYNRMLRGMESIWLCRHAWEYATASVGLTSQQWAQAQDDIHQHAQLDPESVASVRALIGEVIGPGTVYNE